MVDKKDEEELIVENIVDTEISKINQALDFTSNRAYVTVFLCFNTNNGVTRKPVILTSEREMIPFKRNKLIEHNIEILGVPNYIWEEERYNANMIKDFLKNENRVYTFDDIYYELKNLLEWGFDFPDERAFDFIASYIIGTYFFKLFKKYSYLYIWGTKRSGKTKLLTFLANTCFNGVLTLAMTPATIYRLLTLLNCSLMIDETDRIAKKEKGDLRDILNSGYKEGGRVTRTREVVMRDGSRNFITEFYLTFSPKALANIEGMEDVLKDRALTLIMQRSTSLKASRDYNYKEDRWKNLRTKLLLYMLENWKEVNKVYQFIDDIVLKIQMGEIGEKGEMVKNSKGEKVEKFLPMGSKSNGISENFPTEVGVGSNKSSKISISKVSIDNKVMYRDKCIKGREVPTSWDLGGEKVEKGEIISNKNVQKNGHNIFFENLDPLGKKISPFSTNYTVMYINKGEKGEKVEIDLRKIDYNLVNDLIKFLGRKLFCKNLKTLIEVVYNNKELFTSRYKELTMGIISIAFLSKDFDKALTYIRDLLEEKASEESFSIETVILSILIEDLEKPDWIRVTDLSQRIMETQNIKMHSRTIIAILGRLDLISGRRTIHGRTEIFIKPEMVLKKARYYGIDVEKILKEKSTESVSSLKDKILVIIKDLTKFLTYVPIDDVKKEIKKTLDIPEEKIEDYLNRMKDEGVIYEPKPGMIGLIG